MYNRIHKCLLYTSPLSRIIPVQRIQKTPFQGYCPRSTDSLPHTILTFPQWRESASAIAKGDLLPPFNPLRPPAHTHTLLCTSVELSLVLITPFPDGFRGTSNTRCAGKWKSRSVQAFGDSEWIFNKARHVNKVVKKVKRLQLLWF